MKLKNGFSLHASFLNRLSCLAAVMTGSAGALANMRTALRCQSRLISAHNTACSRMIGEGSASAF